MIHQAGQLERMNTTIQTPGQERAPLTEQERTHLTVARDQAIIAGNREGAARMQGELLDLKPVVFPEAVRPRIWTTDKIKELGSPYSELSGRHADFLKSETERLAQTRALSPVRHILHLAGVKSEGLPVISPDTALDIYMAARLVKEVGTFHVDNGGASYRTPDGHLQSFRLPIDREEKDIMDIDQQRAATIISSLQEAGYRPGELPLVITNNPTQNALAFKDQK